MSVLTDFDIAQDLKVEFFIPDESENIFIIGVSEIGGSDVLGGAGWFIIGESLIGGPDVITDGEFTFDWRNLACETSRVETSLGGSVQNATYFQPMPGEASIVLQSYTYDPTNNRTIRPGTGVRVRVSRGSLDEMLFRGYINNINVSYTVEGLNLITITAFDSFSKVVNTRLELFDTVTNYPEGYASSYEVLEEVALGYGTSMNAQSVDDGGRVPGVLETDVIPNNFINDAIQVGLGFFWIDPATEEFVFIPRPGIGEVPLGVYTVGNNHSDPNHLCMSGISISGDYNDVYNSLRVALTSDDAIYALRSDQDSIDLYDIAAIDARINTTDIEQLNLWADKVFTQSPTHLVQSVDTPAVNRLGNLTHAAQILPGELIGVEYQTSNMNINTYYSVVKVSHSINSDTWFTTLELWKEV